MESGFGGSTRDQKGSRGVVVILIAEFEILSAREGTVMTWTIW